MREAAVTMSVETLTERIEIVTHLILGNSRNVLTWKLRYEVPSEWTQLVSMYKKTYALKVKMIARATRADTVSGSCESVPQKKKETD